MAIITQPNAGRSNSAKAVIYPGNLPTASGYVFERNTIETFDAPNNLLTFSNLNGRYLAKDWIDESSIASSGDNTITRASGSDAIIHLNAQPNQSHVIMGISFGYNTTPTNGSLSVQSPSGTTIFTIPVTAAGAGFFPFEKGLKCPDGKEVRIVLSDGFVTKSLSLNGKRVE